MISSPRFSSHTHCPCRCHVTDQNPTLWPPFLLQGEHFSPPDPCVHTEIQNSPIKFQHKYVKATLLSPGCPLPQPFPTPAFSLSYSFLATGFPLPQPFPTSAFPFPTPAFPQPYPFLLLAFPFLSPYMLLYFPFLTPVFPPTYLVPSLPLSFLLLTSPPPYCCLSSCLPLPPSLLLTQQESFPLICLTICHS